MLRFSTILAFLVALLVLPATAAAQQCATSSNPLVRDLREVVSFAHDWRSRRVEAIIALDHGRYDEVQEGTHTLAEDIRAAHTEGSVGEQEAERALRGLRELHMLAHYTEEASDALLDGDTEHAAELLEDARATLDTLLQEGLIPADVAERMGDRLDELSGWVDDLGALLDLLEAERWDDVKAEAHALAEELRALLEDGVLDEATAQALIELLGEIWAEADAAARAGATHLPVPEGTPITSVYGWRIHPVYGDERFHTGTDFAMGYGAEVYATGSGTVEYVGVNGGYGNQVRVRMDDGTMVSYSHLADYAGMTVGHRVEAGDVVGHVNSTGTSTGNHLHLEVHDADGNHQDPEKWFDL